VSVYPPYVIERTSRGERSYDIFSRLLMDRIVFLGSGINDQVANSLVAQLLFLDADDPERDIHMYINSPGGSVYAGMAIYDTMQHIRAPVATYCVGMAASGGADAEAFVLNLMNDERGQLAYGAVQAVGHLRAHTQSANFLTAIVEHPQRGIARELALGLAAWREPEVTRRMTELARDPGIDIDTRRTIQNSIARNLQRAEVDPFLERYWTASSTEDRSVIAGSLGSIGRESRLPAKELAPLVEPLLIDAFSDLDRRVWASAVVSLGSHREFQTPATLAALRALRERTVAESDLALIDRVLSR